MEIRITDARTYKKKKLTVTQTVEEINQEEPATIIDHGKLAEKFVESKNSESPTIGDITQKSDIENENSFFKEKNDNNNNGDFFKKEVVLDEKLNIEDKDMNIDDKNKINTQIDKDLVLNMLKNMRNEQGDIKK